MYMMEKKLGKKGHTNTLAVSALLWSGTPSWPGDDDIIPLELSPSNLVKGLTVVVVVVVVVFFFCPSATRLFPSHPSLFSIFRLLRTFLYIKEESVRGIHVRGDIGRKKNLISLSSFLPIIAFLDKFIVSSEPDGVAPRYHQRLQETNTIPLFLRIWSPSLITAQRREPLAEFKRSPSTLRSRTTRYSHGL